MGPIPDVYQAIIANMAEGVLFLDHHHVIRICNTAAETIRGVKADKIVGRSIFDIHPSRAHPQISDLLGSLQSGAVPSINRIVRIQNRFFDNSYSGIRDVHGDFLGTLLVSRDITEERRLTEENAQLKNVLVAKDREPTLVFSSPAMERVLATVEAVAPLDSTVLVSGESGTGKECIVDLLHRLSQRASMPLVKVNCAALPENLVESELFGHVRGAFTGALADHKGKFVLAAGGTLFLDEIGELPLLAQVKLLRAIQDKVIQPVGGKNEVRVDVRIVAATNRDLARSVAEGAFREDLFYRLNVIPVEVPPLRQRREDIVPLAEAFIDYFSRVMKRPRPQLSREVQDLLGVHPLPGNVRQLKHAMERSVALGRGDAILPVDLPQELLSGGYASPAAVAAATDLRSALGACERELIERTLRLHGGRKGAAAEALGITRKSLWEKLQRHGIARDVTEQ